MLDILLSIFDMLPVGVVQGLLLAFVALGIALPFRILKLPDFTSEGAYPLGGAVFGCLINFNLDPYSSTLLAALFGALAGMCTGLIYSKLKINSLLAGIIVSTMIYAVNLRLLGKPNMGLFEFDKLLSQSIVTQSLALVFILLFVFLALNYFLKTQPGLRLRAVGLNRKFCELNKVNSNFYIVLGFVSGGFLCALSGALTVQVQSYVDVGMGVGIVIHGLAALMIGESFFKNLFAAAIFGAVIYQIILIVIISIGFEPNDLKFVTGLIVLLVMAMRMQKINEE